MIFLQCVSISTEMVQRQKPHITKRSVHTFFLAGIVLLLPVTGYFGIINSPNVSALSKSLQQEYNSTYCKLTSGCFDTHHSCVAYPPPIPLVFPKYY